VGGSAPEPRDVRHFLGESRVAFDRRRPPGAGGLGDELDGATTDVPELSVGSHELGTAVGEEAPERPRPRTGRLGGYP
jgi:hypothetical protein